MNRLKKVIRNIIVITILFVLLLMRTGIYLSPLSAHEHSERSIHYGPSKVAHIEDFEKGKYILGKYDKWVSCDTVNRELFFFWRFGDQPVGFENDKTKAVSYTYSFSNPYDKAYGIVNDKRVKKIEITLSNGDILTQTNFYDDLFLLTWKSDDNENTFMKILRGYDSYNNIIFEEKQPYEEK
ncbi:MAG: hypothetical protein Q8930_08320 [Bacillota bacterium]|nr:hypothetical protein [Bacillota bacterium]